MARAVAMDSRFRDAHLFDHLSLEELETIARCLSSPPLMTTLRINTLLASRQEALEQARALFMKDGFDPQLSPNNNEIIEIRPLGPIHVHPHPLQVIVSTDCAKAVLRGAHVFAPGIIAVLDNGAGAVTGQSVSVWADLQRRYTKGARRALPENEATCLFLANGELSQSRDGFFGPDVAHPRGLGVNCKERTFALPALNGLPPALFPQSLPSILAVQALNPLPGSIVLDMCASPGGKTSHLAALMRNTGCIIALDKNAKKVSTLRDNMSRLGVTNVSCFVRNSAKLFHPKGSGDLSAFIKSGGIGALGPAIFEYILLDPPCSAFGQRPELGPAASLDFNEHASYQKCLFEAAYNLLKPGGHLLYSTCSISLQENEDVISEMLASHSDLELVPIDHMLAPGHAGFQTQGLTLQQSQFVRRFLPTESIGFFFAKFMKKI